MNNEKCFDRISRIKDKIASLEKNIRFYERKLKENAIKEAEDAGYSKGSCFRIKNGEVFAVVDHKIKRYVLLNEFVISVFLICRKVNKKGFLDKRESNERVESLRGIEKILHEDQNVVFKENLNAW